MIKEIQGLRSISVFLILFYHLNISYFKLGFLAVDIFFIISGIIFSKLIFTDINNKNFSILEYAKRRIRRLFPGLVILLSLVTLVSWFFLIPHELKYYGQNLFSSSVFASNIYFYIVNNDYFSPNTYSLLHLWSLSLELQFYFIYPLIILFIHNFTILKKNLNKVFFVIFVTSFFLNIYLSYDEKFVFYLLPTRFWEFLVGYFIYEIISKNKSNFLIRNNFYLNLIIFIFINYLVFGNNLEIKQQILTIFVVLSVFFFGYNKKNILNLFLTNSFNLNIAKYSYTIFLVHFPIIYFYKYFGYYEENLKSILLVCLFIFIFTYIIYNLEKFFFSNHKNNSHYNFKFSYLIFLLFINSSVGLYFHKSKGIEGRYLLNKKISDKYITYTKHFESSKILNGRSCNILCKKNIGNKKTLLLFGDSHAGDFEFELTKILNKKKINLYLSYYDYRQTNNFALDQLSEVLKNEKINFILLVHHKKEDDKTFYKKLAVLLNTYPDTKFYYFLPRVEFQEAPVKYKLLNKSFDKIKRYHFKDIINFLNSIKFSNFVTIDQNKYLLKFQNSSCDNPKCINGHDDKNLPLYRDNHHLSSYGSSLFINELFKDLSFN